MLNALCSADLVKVEACRKIIQKVDEEFNRIDCLVNFTAINDGGAVMDTSPEPFDQIFIVNTRAPFFLIQRVLQTMIWKKIKGNIVNVQNTSGYWGQTFITAYCGYEEALSILTKTLHSDLCRNKFKSMDLTMVGWIHQVRIEFSKFYNLPKNWLQDTEKNQLFERLPITDEVALGIVFLSTEESCMIIES